jgi:GTPase SAR1 family protein
MNEHRRALFIMGPKGLGKTTAIRQLSSSKEGSLYIDFAKRLPPDLNKVWLFLDNAQMYNSDVVQKLNAEQYSFGDIMELIAAHDFIVAAFSPGANVGTSRISLGKAIEDGTNVAFHWRPFTLQESTQ